MGVHTRAKPSNISPIPSATVISEDLTTLTNGYEIEGGHPHETQTSTDIPDDQELRDGINEQMNLFWGAVSSAFGDTGQENEHGTEQGREEDHPSQVETDGHLGISNDQAYLENGQVEHRIGDDQHGHEQDHPRNEWEHVHLLMSLGGQLGHDIGAGNEMENMETLAEASQTVINEQPGLMDRTRSARETLERGGSGHGTPLHMNAEAGPSNYQHVDGVAPNVQRAAQTLGGTQKNGSVAITNEKKQKVARKSKIKDASGRQLLSAAERKANHVSSEKRRRNAIRIGYAELGAIEHMSVNVEWPPTGELEAVIEESKDMEGMEELTGRKRGRDQDLAGAEGVDPLLEGSAIERSTIAPPVETPIPHPKGNKRTKKGIYIVNQGNTSKSAILKKGAALAHWLSEGNDWLRSEIERLESLLGVPPGQPLEEYVVGEHGLVHHMLLDEHAENRGDEHGHGHAGERNMEDQLRIEDHFIQAAEALRPPPEDLGPDGYPRDPY